MVENNANSNANAITNTNDPDVLLQMVEELAMEEITPEIFAKMELVEIALADFMEEKSAALLSEQDAIAPNGLESPMQPSPPEMPPPGALLDSDSDSDSEAESQWRRGRFENDLARAGFALEKLRQRMRYGGEETEEDVPLEAERAWQLSLEEEEILQQAEEALRKSREAAKRRKAEAERRSVTAANMFMPGYRQRFQEQQPPNQQRDPQGPAENPITDTFPADEEYAVSNQSRPSEDFDSLGEKRKRSTIELGTLFGKRAEGESATITDSDDDDWSNEEWMEELENRALEGIPVLYNWVQDEDGCITGKVRRSINFIDGATISTSPVIRGAFEGTVVTTESGSRYFLGELSTTETAEEEGSLPITAEGSSARIAPDGVPTIKCWEFRKGAGIVGLIYGSPDADDGDYIETSPIVDGEIENYSVVYTQSGSCYFLSGDPPENALDTLLSFRDGGVSNESRQEGGTITLTKLGRRKDSRDEGSPRSRSTFSLFDLFDGTRNANASFRSNNAAPRPMAPPSPDKVPPTGTPTLTGYVFNDDGTITGYIFGSPKIEDGYLITTSPIVEGDRMQFETVTTETGSLYFLG
eukprot:jgi/Psemu1/322938/estExt_fgenesh1_pg.C_480041